METASTTSAVPQTRLAKTALFLNLLSWLFLFAGLGFFSLLDAGNPDGYVILGVGSATWIVLSIWCIVLGWRSHRNGEALHWRYGLTLLVLFEWSAAFVFLWYDRYEHWSGWFSQSWIRSIVGCAFACCLPVFTLFGLVAVSVLALVHRWRPRFVLASPRKKWIAHTVIALPFLICTLLYSLLTVTRYSPYDPRVTLASLLPNFITDRIEAGLASIDSARAYEMRNNLLSRGLVSKNRLLKRAEETNSKAQEGALSGLAHHYFTDALELARELGSKNAWHSSLEIYWAADFIANRTSPEQLRTILDAQTEFSPIFRDRLFIYLTAGHRERECIEDVLRYAAEEFNGKGHIVVTILGENRDLAPDAETIERAWLKLFTLREWPGRAYLLDVVVDIPELKPKLLGLMLLCLNDEELRGSTHGFFSIEGHEPPIVATWEVTAPADRVKCIQSLSKMLDEPNDFIRRNAALGLAYLMRIRANSIPELWCADKTDAEAAETARVRAAAQKWLKENDTD